MQVLTAFILCDDIETAMRRLNSLENTALSTENESNMYILSPEFKDDMKESLRLSREILTLLKKEQSIIMADLTQLQADVTAEVTVEQSAITLIEGLAAAYQAAGTDPAAIAALDAEVNTSSAALAAAVSANTPAATAAPAPAAAAAPPAAAPDPSVADPAAGAAAAPGASAT
jgi:vacuolar-type H+-ATPase subunit D/Vma8